MNSTSEEEWIHQDALKIRISSAQWTLSTIFGQDNAANTDWKFRLYKVALAIDCLYIPDTMLLLAMGLIK